MSKRADVPDLKYVGGQLKKESKHLNANKRVIHKAERKVWKFKLRIV